VNLPAKYVQTHDKKIIDELYELARQLEKLERIDGVKPQALRAGIQVW
jgi:hypothetical protein